MEGKMIKRENNMDFTDVESATKKNIYEINAYYMKYFPDSNGRFQ